MPNTQLIRIEQVMAGPGTHGFDVVVRSAAARFPYAGYSALQAAIGFLALCRPKLAQIQSYNTQLCQDYLSTVQAHTANCILIRGKETPFEYLSNLPTNTPQFRIAVSPEDIELSNFPTGLQIARFHQSDLEILRAPIEERNADRFFETMDHEATSRRRRVWTAACLGSTSILPSSPDQFLQTAEIISYALAQEIEWDQSEASRQARIAAAIRAGIVLPDLTLTRLIEHPSVAEWRRILEIPVDGSFGGSAPKHFSMLPSRIVHTFRAWAQSIAFGAPLSGHDMLEANDLLQQHEKGLSAMRNGLLQRVSGFSMPPPLEKL